MAETRADWDNDLTKIFLDLCIAEKEKLNYNKKGLTKHGWNNLYRNFRQQTELFYDTKQLQNKFNSLKRLYRAWRKVKAASGLGWDSRTGTITMDEEGWQNQIAEEPLVKTFQKKPLQHQEELDTLFASMVTEDGNMFCVGGIGDSTQSDGSDDNTPPTTDDNVRRSSVGCAAKRSGKEQAVDSPPPNRTKSKSVEYYVERLSETMLERSRNESSAKSREQDEVTELLRVVEEDGVGQGSELYFIATELFRSAARRASFRSFRNPGDRIAWLRWTWENAKK